VKLEVPTVAGVPPIVQYQDFEQSRWIAELIVQ
jgi:hypothetical protein